MTTGMRKPHDFCWINMLTPQPAEARAFFGQLLGWTYEEMPNIGHGILVDGHHIGGLFDLNGPGTPPGLQPLIGVMVKVESADASSEKAASLGGKVGQTFDVMEKGRMSVLYDPNGAQFDIWEPKELLGTDADNRRHGVPSWFETLTTDVERGTAFYSELFGWTSEIMEAMPGLTYTTFKLDGEPIAGMMAITPDMGAMPPHWGIYFTVDDADATVKLTAELGGTVFIPVQPIPKVGRFCGLISPQGVRFYAVQYVAG